jgi:Flp pilus assembly protein CpaB
MAGYFNKPPAEPPPPKKAEIQVLVAAHNLFAGDVIDSNGIRVRVLRPEEEAHYQGHKDQYLPPVVSAGWLRVTNKNIEADQPILRDSLKEMRKPEPLNTRLLPDMRAIDISVPKERSAGGLIQVGEWVEIHLTSSVESNGSTTTRTAILAPRSRVIAKRDTLWDVFAPLPDDKPVHFTLEVSAYRAAVVEYSRNKGYFSLVPLPMSEQRRLDEQREQKLKQVAQGIAPAAIDAKGPAVAEDDTGADANRDLVVTEADLVRLFGLTSPAPPLSTITIDRISGVHRVEPAAFTSDGTPTSNSSAPGAQPARAAAAAKAAIRFSQPKDCPTCKEKRALMGK